MKYILKKELPLANIGDEIEGSNNKGELTYHHLIRKYIVNNDFAKQHPDFFEEVK